MSQYAARDIEALGDLYFKHVDAMTAEHLHSKAEIAAELAYRDAEIAELRKAVDAVLSADFTEWWNRNRHMVTPTPGDLATKHAALAAWVRVQNVAARTDGCPACFGAKKDCKTCGGGS